MKDVALEILRLQRGNRSAAQFSRRLGFKSNQIARWESGHSVFTWADLLDVCAREGVPVRDQLEKRTLLNGDPADLKRLFLYYLPNYSNANISRRLKVAPSTVTKWMRNQTSPPAQFIFHLMKDSKVSWTSFVSSFLPDAKVPHELGAEEVKLRNILATNPLTEVILHLLNREEALLRSESARIFADRLGLEFKLVKQLIDDLTSAGLLNWSAEGRCKVNPLPDNLDVSSSKDAVYRYLRFWTDYHLRIGKHSEFERKTMSAFATIAVDKENVDKVRQLTIGYINQMIELSQPKGERVFNMTVLLSDVETKILGSGR